MRKFSRKTIEKAPKNEVLRGMKAGMPICLGYISVSCAFGMSICSSGFPVWLSGLISFTNLTSAGQFAGTNLMLAKAGYLEIAITTIIINLRYFLMSLALSQKLNGDFKVFQRFSMAHGVTDEIFALAIGQSGLLNPDFMRGLIITPIIGWTTGTVLGGIFSQILPDVVVSAMNIALYAMFLAIILPPARKNKPVAITVLLAIALSCIFTYVPFFSFLSGGWSIIVITLLVAGFAAWKFPIKTEEDESHVN